MHTVLIFGPNLSLVDGCNLVVIVATMLAAVFVVDRLLLLGWALILTTLLQLPSSHVNAASQSATIDDELVQLRELCLEHLDSGDAAAAADLVALIATGGIPDASLQWSTEAAAARFREAAALLESWWKVMPRSMQRKHAKRTRRRDKWLAAKAHSGEQHQQLAVATVSAALVAYQHQQLHDPSQSETGMTLLCDALATLASVAMAGHTDDSLAAGEILSTALLACPSTLMGAIELERHARSVQQASEQRLGLPKTDYQSDAEITVARRYFERGQELQQAGRLAEASAIFEAISTLHRGYHNDDQNVDNPRGQGSQEVWARLTAPRIAKLRRIYSLLRSENSSESVEDATNRLVSEQLCDMDEALQLSLRLAGSGTNETDGGAQPAAGIASEKKANEFKIEYDGSPPTHARVRYAA